ncbi:SH3 domain-containing protein (plasmid) [Cereibacter azotoformans]|uniref:SH3 domain-containing protein n=1 Tax=Cereibacter azotoformans TaxID=43057 RepID=A0A2T5JUM3_9RHOB|nr:MULTISPECIES: SH3 domain-containing protein [Cereibacter]AXQ96195.1 SH3 domain-containing protein [Cereibacter sphaeroides]PTR13869.1 SH3 domain-containing protein [Cereibacter azotoformans]UIJ33150.1 SH3 domain-containing protein [Cereibacter azotoformans]
MRYMFRPVLAAILLVAGCAGDAGGMGSRVTVERAGGELLKLRAGPGLGYRVLLGLPDGTALVRHGCVTEVGQRWCRVSLVEAPRLTGYVAADYLSRR